jgi:hypothetical protein
VNLIATQTGDGGDVACTYVTDPEDNAIELQSWSDTRPTASTAGGS